MHNILLILLVLALGSALPAQAAGFGKRAKVQVQSQPLPPQQVTAQPAVAQPTMAQPVVAQPAMAQPVVVQQAATAPAPITPQAPMVHYQAPPTLPNGNPNLIHYWYEYGGARLYWQGLLDPQQVKLLGPAWRDPAQHAQLTDTGYGAGRPAKRKWRSKKAAPAKKAACPNNSCGNKVACPSSTCAGSAACTCGAAQSSGAAQSQPGKAPDNAAKPAAAPKADLGKNVPRTYQPGQLGPGPKPTTYTEVTPKAAAIVSQSAPSANAAPGLPMPAPMPVASPAPLVPAAQPVSAATQATTQAAGQMSGQTGGGSTGRISQQ